MAEGFTIVFNERTGKNERVSVEGLLNLANAIIVRACIDYNSSEYRPRRFVIENFLKSEYGKILLRDAVPPAKIISFLRGENNGT